MTDVIILLNDNVSKGNAFLSIEKDELRFYSGEPRKEIHTETAKIMEDDYDHQYPLFKNINVFKFSYTIWEYHN